MDRPLVFVSCGATTAPLLRLLAARYTPVVPGDHLAADLVRRGVAAISWTAAVDPGLEARVAAETATYGEAWREELEGERGPGQAMADRLGRELAGHVYARELGRRLGASGRLAAVVTHEDVTGVMRAFLAGVQTARVPSLHVPHGIYADEAVAGADVHGTLHCDLAAVGGPAQRDWFLRRGVAAERLVVTGNPAWDHLLHAPAGPRPTLGLPPGRVVTVAASWFGGGNAYTALTRWDQARRLRAAFIAVARLQAAEPSLRLVVKLHPSTPPAQAAAVRALACGAGARADLVVADRLGEILAASDALVTLPSTLAVEAVLAGVPVVAVGCRYPTAAIRSVAVRPAAVRAALRAALAEGRGSAAFAAARADCAARYHAPGAGLARERVAAVVDALVAGGRLARAPALRLVMFPRWTEPEWETGLGAYLNAFAPGERTTLTLAVPARELASGGAEAAVRAAFARLGHDPAASADVALEPLPPDPDTLAAAADALVLCGGEPPLAARRVVRHPTPAALRALRIEAGRGA